MPEVVINTCYGGFSLSWEACDAYRLKAGLPSEARISPHYDFNRDDPNLVEVVKELGERANGMRASLQIVNIPDDVKWTIEEYEGKEWVEEVARRWYS